MDEVFRLYEAILKSSVAYGFSVTILVLFSIAVAALLYQSLTRSDRFGGFTRSAAAQFTTIGVLGTFFGIFLGLLDFNVANIDASIQQLLTGLKIAFSTRK